MTAHHYDYVIVGAGSAGCVLASRLSEDPSRSVLLLEAGDDFPDVASMPPALTTGRFLPNLNPGFVWNYAGVGTPKQPNPYSVIRGKVLGGSGAINGANFVRNVPEDFDAWGSDLWSFDAVLPFFCKLETDQDFTGELHGTDGPILVGRSPRESWGAFHEVFYDAALAAGFAEKPDLSDRVGSGVGSLPRNDITGVRMNCALAYLNPARGRENLAVRPRAHVLRVLFENDRATGVEAVIDGHVEAIAAGEVVLAAGAIESPHILLVSGIGPSDDLKQLGIPVIADLPVGENLTDHGTAHIEYVEASHGLEATEPLLQAVGLIFTAPDSPYRNDVRLQSTAGLGAQASTPAGGVRAPGKVSVNCILDRPTTAGKLSLTSADPTVPPILDYRYLSNDFDLQRMRFAVREAIRIMGQDVALHSVAERLAPLDEDLASDAALDSWLQANYRTAFHTCGTAKLGPAGDHTAVVDEHCRVQGVDGLRVVDLSIVPTVGRASMNPTAIMLGERAAALIDGG